MSTPCHPDAGPETLAADAAAGSPPAGAASRPRRRALATVAALGVTAGALAGPTASHAGLDLPFTDVSVTHPFYEEIRWLYGAGVTTGYADGTFRPGEPVTRQAMAAYLERYSDLLPTIRTDSVYTSSFSTTSLTQTNVPELSVTFTVPEGESVEANVLARFSAESRCTGSNGWCTVRILLDGVEMSPAVGSDLAFDSTDGGTEGSGSYESHAMERSNVVEPGIHTVTVQANVSSAGVTLTLDDMMLAVESFPIV